MRRVVALLLILAPPVAGAVPPLCRVRTSVEPSTAVVDQQVLHRVSIESRSDVHRIEWLTQPTFSDVRAERLPGLPDMGKRSVDGVELRRREEHRALFPERPGALTLGEASLRCFSAHEVTDVHVPPVTLRVDELPQTGRPASFTGVVGAVSIVSRVDRTRIELGGSVRLEITIQGGANVWDAPDPLADDFDLGGAGLFRHRPELDLDRGTSLIARRRFLYDVVPRRTGSLRIPSLRIAYFDPDSARFAEAVTDPTDITVVDRSSAPLDRHAAAARDHRADEPGPSLQRVEPERASSKRVVPLCRLVGLLGLVAVAGIGIWFARSRLRSDASPPLLEVRRSLDARDGARAAALLREAVRRLVADAGIGSPDEILAEHALDSRARALVELWARVERARFDPRAELPPAAAVDELDQESDPRPE